LLILHNYEGGIIGEIDDWHMRARQAALKPYQQTNASIYVAAISISSKYQQSLVLREHIYLLAKMF
jgi:hypothetical protein